MKNNKEEIKELNNKLIKHSQEYYENNISSISDEQYDGMYQKYLSLISEHPDYEPKDSIARKVGSSSYSKFTKVEHAFPMLSLGNAFDTNDLIKFDNHIKRQLGVEQNFKYSCELKIDGLSISVIYKNGKLWKAITRGDGITGEDVTENVMQIKSIPQNIKYKNNLEVRGEIFITKKVFDKINSSENGKYANPRNLASGTLRQLDSKIVRDRNLSAFLYTIPNPLNHNLLTQEKVLNFLEGESLPINKETVFVDSIYDVEEQCKKFTKMRDDLDYEIDGVVIKLNDITKHEDIGNTSKFPKSMIAYKFPAEVSSTELIGIDPTVGRTGRITYNARLVPVRLAGSVIENATLHNADYVNMRNINIGDIVNVKKAGDIIPRVTSLHKKNNNDIWLPANNCPSCDSVLSKVRDEVDQYCPNDLCEEKRLAFFENAVSKYCLNIEGLSTEIIRLFIQKEIITSYSSIFGIPNHKEQILLLPGFKEKLTMNIINSVKKSMNTSLERFLSSLGIRHIGRKNSQILAQRFGAIKNIMKASNDEICNIRSLGSKAASSIVDYFNNEINMQEINKSIEYGLNITETKKPVSDILKGMTFVITGSLSKPRDFFKKSIESHNGNVSNSVSKKTDYLLAGEKSGSKLDKATQYNVKILKEEDYNTLLKGKDNEKRTN